jgi:methionyl aminopeptidase
MINLGTKDVYTLDDGWTVVTADGKPSCHYEHTTLVRRNSGEALSSFGPIEAAERKNPELSKGHLSEVVPQTTVA